MMGARKAEAHHADVTRKTDEPRLSRDEPKRPVGKERPDAQNPPGAGAIPRASDREDTNARRDDDPLDPMNRRAAELAPPTAVGMTPAQPLLSTLDATASATSAAPEMRARASLEELLPALVRRIAWAGNGTKGSVRMELGRGSLAGATVLVHAEQGRVRVEVSAPADCDASEWRRRIDARLRERGLDVESVEVT